MGISINHREISAQAINVESAWHQEPGADPRLAQRRAAVALTVRELLRQRAEQLGMPIPADDAGLDITIEKLIEQEVDVPEADSGTCRHWYDQNPDYFHSPDIAEVRHILLAAPPELLEEREAARTIAEELIRQLQHDPQAFPRLAREYSHCPSADNGGLLGQVSKGETVPEFEDAIMRLDVGLAEKPVKSRYGFHVVEVLQRIAGEKIPFELAQERIATYLEELSRRRALSQYIRMLAGEAEIKGIDLEAAESPLVQ
ncbi:MAG TPA: peptidylprolyl isomerase [Gammaproteobacteria bacterium]|nr:peptidylprolyl isomerase [Gammaproteobacteria bacterium]